MLLVSSIMHAALGYPADDPTKQTANFAISPSWDDASDQVSAQQVRNVELLLGSSWAGEKRVPPSRQALHLGVISSGQCPFAHIVGLMADCSASSWISSPLGSLHTCTPTSTDSPVTGTRLAASACKRVDIERLILLITPHATTVNLRARISS